VVREHEVDRIVQDKMHHRVNQFVIVWAFSLYYSDHEKVGMIIKALETNDERQIKAVIGENTVQFMLIGSNHNHAANLVMHQKFPNDPNFSHMRCLIFIQFKYKDNDNTDLGDLHIVRLFYHFFNVVLM